MLLHYHSDETPDKHKLTTAGIITSLIIILMVYTRRLIKRTFTGKPHWSCQDHIVINAKKFFMAPTLTSLTRFITWWPASRFSEATRFFNTKTRCYEKHKYFHYKILGIVGKLCSTEECQNFNYVYSIFTVFRIIFPRSTN